MKSNQNLLIAQVVNLLNRNGYLAWRQENNGRIDEAQVVDRITQLLFALAHVNYDKVKIASLVTDIIRKSYRPVPSSLKGVPDVIGFHLDSGRWISVEVKCGNDQLREDQIRFIDILRRSGGEVWVIRDIDSFRDAFLNKHFQSVSS